MDKKDKILLTILSFALGLWWLGTVLDLIFLMIAKGS